MTVLYGAHPKHQESHVPWSFTQYAYTPSKHQTAGHNEPASEMLVEWLVGRNCPDWVKAGHIRPARDGASLKCQL